MAEQLTPVTLDLEVRGSSLTHRVVSLDKELYSNFSLFTQVYERVRWTSIPCSKGGAVLLGMLHATETGISSGRVGLWLVCAFTFTTFPKTKASLVISRMNISTVTYQQGETRLIPKDDTQLALGF